MGKTAESAGFWRKRVGFIPTLKGTAMRVVNQLAVSTKLNLDGGIPLPSFEETMAMLDLDTP